MISIAKVATVQKARTQTATIKRTDFFAKIPRAIIRNKDITAATEYIYSVMVDLADFRTHIAEVTISVIAKNADKSPRTIRRHLAVLEKLGLVVRVFRKDPNHPKLNMPSLFFVRNSDISFTSDTADTDGYLMGEGGVLTKMSKPLDKNDRDKKERDNERENNKDTLKREVQELPQEIRVSEISFLKAKADTPTATQPLEKQKLPVTLDLSDIPTSMQPVVEYLLQNTGRMTLNPKEYRIIRNVLDKQHTPTRVIKEIDRCIERFIHMKRSLKYLTFCYIGHILSKQVSLTRKRNMPVENTKSAESAQEGMQIHESALKVKERIVPIDEAEQVIADYKPAVREQNGFPVALEELFTKIVKREDEIVGKYASSLPQTDEGLPDWNMAEKDADGFPVVPSLTLDEYLRLKFPEAKEEELNAACVYDKRGLEQAFETDRTCALCCSASDCRFNRKGGRPVVMLKNHKLEVGYTTCIRCKHDKNKPDPELDRRMKASGLTERQSKQTFANYKHEGMPAEIVSAKAHAILSAKNHSSLILAGKSGTGKTHLAIAIAIDTMKNGRSALFRSVPEMLDELRQAAQEHNDFYGKMRRLKDVSCLVLDDWGKERTTEAGMDYLYQIIDYRYQHGMQTIVTTNALNMNGLKNHWNAEKIEPLVSRILENGEWVTINQGESYRLKKFDEPENPA